MATKRLHSPDLVPNPFIKKRNLDWSIDITGLPHDAESSASSFDGDEESPGHQDEEPTPPEIEAGRASIDDHLSYFSALLAKGTLSPFPSNTPNLSLEGYKKLYEMNSGSSRGAHFIIHQHDHPIAGVHYDLRLQINETSSASWAIMYGLPGDPNSFRLNRNATETRIHCLWNHLIETGSHETGSLLIWDTGTYSILPTKFKGAHADSQSSTDEDTSGPQLTEQEKLHQAFAARKIRLQLHGTRLPEQYVLNLRLTREDDAAGRMRSTRVPKTRRRRGAPSSISSRVTRSSTRKNKAHEPDTSSDSEPENSRRRTKAQQASTGTKQIDGEDDYDGDIVHAPAEEFKSDGTDISPTERELRELEDEEVRRTNAYPGANNSIGSVHQRRWFLSLDREASGFVKRRGKGKVVWERAGLDLRARPEPREANGDKGDTEDTESGANRLDYPFYVRGVEHERSVVTGRLGSEVLRDQGVEGYIGRKGWQAILK